MRPDFQQQLFSFSLPAAPIFVADVFLKPFHPVAKKHHSHLFSKHGFTYWTSIPGTVGFRDLMITIQWWEGGDNLPDFMKYIHICPIEPKGQ